MLVGYNLLPHLALFHGKKGELRPCRQVSASNWKRNFFFTDTTSVHTSIRWKRSMKTELFENALQSGTFWKRCFRVYVFTDENGTFRKRWGHTISSNPLRAILETYSRWRTGASVVFYTWAYFWPNCLFSSKFSFANSSSWLFQEAAEHYQVTFATGVKRRKVGSPFSLTL